MNPDRLSIIFILLFCVLFVSSTTFKRLFVNSLGENTKNSIGNSEDEDLRPRVIGCKWFKGCVDVSTFDIVKGKASTCENCEEVVEMLTHLPISSMKNNNTFISSTRGISFKSKELNQGSKVIMIDEMDTLASYQKKIIVYGNFKPIGKIECASNNENKQKLNFEFFLQYIQKNYDLVIDLNMDSIFNANKEESPKVISDWNLTRESKSHSIYFFRTIEKDKTQGLEYVSDIFLLGKNNTLPLFELICYSKKGCNANQFKVFATISCPKNKNKDEKNRQLKINDIVTLIRIIKKNSTYKKYISRIKLFIETLLKILERKVKSQELSYKCTNEIVEWIKELCVLLGISSDDIFKSKAYFFEAMDINKIKEYERDQSKYSNISSEVTAEQYRYLENILIPGVK
ncbi:signal peptide protein [Cryptosporidium bovis]|uniref:signal peptide protein n=1 Tax=Cryptosporidium bovis TaxID=310047 RepID=UPI00351AA065|nr:signal peptide protein [Cryptosporidium bovis]